MYKESKLGITAAKGFLSSGIHCGVKKKNKDLALVYSTGVIGQFLPIDNILKGIKRAADELSTGAHKDAAEAIKTTDTFTKEYAVEINVNGKIVKIGGMAKGSGMIAPNMATMLAF